MIGKRPSSTQRAKHDQTLIPMHLRACLKKIIETRCGRFGAPPLGGFHAVPPKGGTPNRVFKQALRLFAALLSTAFLAVIAAAVAAPAPLTLYVATNGNDLWSGRLVTPNKARTDGPLSSLAAARDRIRGERIGNQPVQLLVRGGTYCLPAPFVLEPQDSGTAETPVVYAAFQREKPVFSGGRAIAGFRQTGNLWETTIPEV